MAKELAAVTSDNITVIKQQAGKGDKAIIDIDYLEDLLSSQDEEYLSTIKKSRERNELHSMDEVFGSLLDES